MNEVSIMGFPFSIKHYSGTIIHVNASQNIQTTTVGGGGRIGPDIFGETRGEIEPTKTYTQTNVTQEIHYKDSSGKEDYFRLVNRNLPFREGQEIGLVYVFYNNGGQLFFLCIYNLQKKYKIESDYRSIIDTVYKEKYKRIHSFIALAIGAGLCYLSFPEKPIVGIVLLFMAYFFTKRIFSGIQKAIIKGAVVKQMEPIWEKL